MKVNDSKTECFIFYKNDTMSKTLIMGETEVTTSRTINVLGITFDCNISFKIVKIEIENLNTSLAFYR